MNQSGWRDSDVTTKLTRTYWLFNNLKKKLLKMIPVACWTPVQWHQQTVGSEECDRSCDAVFPVARLAAGHRRQKETCFMLLATFENMVKVLHNNWSRKLIWWLQTAEGNTEYFLFGAGVISLAAIVQSTTNYLFKTFGLHSCVGLPGGFGALRSCSDRMNLDPFKEF